VTTAFVDSSAWIALVVQRDAQHTRARDLFRSIARDTKLVTSNGVLGESLTFLTYRNHRTQALQLKAMIEAAAQTNLLALDWVTQEVHDRAWEIYERFEDHTFSYWDCSSFAICEARGVDFVFGFDRDFEIAGFQLRP